MALDASVRNVRSPGEEMAEVRPLLMIGGVWRDAGDGRRFAVDDPATGAHLADVADATVEDAADAMRAASLAQREWARRPSRLRADVLRLGYDAVIASRERLAALIALEAGKPIAEARAEVDYAADYLRWFAEEAVRVDGRYQDAPNGGLRHLIDRRPVGPCLLITPWNFPLAMITRKVGPAIAAGCTMVLKPSELTPLTAALFVELMEAAGLPPGVLNLITTTRAEAVVGSLLVDRRLRKISFTGSTRVGRRLIEGSAANILRVSMELGGNAPFLLFDDADLEAAVEGAVQAKLRNAGQACTAANRFFVQDGVAEEFTVRLAARFRALLPDVGPLISPAARGRVHGAVRDALDRGSRLLCGGAVPEGPGYHYPPTVLSDVPVDAEAMAAEIFGPVAAIRRFSTEEQAIEMANASDYGLAAYAYTRDLDRAMRLKDGIEAGMLGINTGILSDPAAPFGGIKHSGLGREGGAEGIGEYLVTQYVGLGRGASPPLLQPERHQQESLCR